MTAKERIICALDTDKEALAVELTQQLAPHVGVFKVGLEFLTNVGANKIATLQSAGATKLFYDGKLHDIPNTVAGAMRGVVRLGAWCVTVHATGGSAMLCAAVKAGREESRQSGLSRPKVLAVTVLTSMHPETLANELQVPTALSNYVRDLALLARDSGCDGVISSPQEIEVIRRAIPDPDFLIVTPGVRPAGVDVGDQARVMTPGEAIRRGADYLVLGRAITADPDPVAAVQRVAEEVSEALAA